MGLATEQDLREGPRQDPHPQAPCLGTHPCPFQPSSHVAFPREGSAHHTRHPPVAAGRGRLRYQVPVYAAEERVGLDVGESGLRPAAEPLFGVLGVRVQ